MSADLDHMTDEQRERYAKWADGMAKIGRRRRCPRVEEMLKRAAQRARGESFYAGMEATR